MGNGISGKRRSLFFPDNASTVSFLSKCATKTLASITWLKRVFYASLRHDYHFTARYVPGLSNVADEALSQMTESTDQFQRFKIAKAAYFSGQSLPRDPFCSYPTPESGEKPTNTPSTSDVQANTLDEKFPVAVIH